MKYRKKPIVVEAYQTDKEMVIHTLEGDMKADKGDYIITGVNGEQYPCKPDVFEKTYEIVGEDMQNERDRLIELIFEVSKERDCTIENTADYLLSNGVIVPPCKIGDTVWFLLEDDFPVHKWFLSEEKITEVASKGFFTSSFAEPCGVEDFGNYTAYSEVGKEAFFNKPEAERALKEREGK